MSFGRPGPRCCIILLSLSSIVWVALALRQLNVVTSQGQDVWMLIKMTTLALPNLMAIIAPFSLLIASIHTLNRLNGDSELIVLTASGATVWRAAKPLMALALLVALASASSITSACRGASSCCASTSCRCAPISSPRSSSRARSRAPRKGLTFHIREREPNGELLGLIVHDTRNKELNQSYLAERGVIVQRPPSNFMVMSNGHIVRRTDKDEPSQIIAFEKYAVDLDQFEKKMDEDGEDLKPRERYLSELLYPEESSAATRSRRGSSAPSCMSGSRTRSTPSPSS